MDTKIETHINIVPFGTIHYSSKGGVVSSEGSKEIYMYQVPQTTDIDSLEFSIEDEVTLAVPSQEAKAFPDGFANVFANQLLGIANDVV